MTIQEIVESIDYCLERNNGIILTKQEDLRTIKKHLKSKYQKSHIKPKNIYKTIGIVLLASAI